MKITFADCVDDIPVRLQSPTKNLQHIAVLTFASVIMRSRQAWKYRAYFESEVVRCKYGRGAAGPQKKPRTAKAPTEAFHTSTKRGTKSAPPPVVAVPTVVAPVAPAVASVVAPCVEVAEADERGEGVEDGAVGVEDGSVEAEGVIQEPAAPQGRVTRGQASGGAPAGPTVPAAPKPRTPTVYRPAKDNEKAQAIWARMADGGFVGKVRVPEATGQI